LVLGTTILISPFEIKHTGLYFNPLIFSFLVAVLFWIFARTKNEINRKEGVILFSVYWLFVIIETVIEALINI